MKKAFSLVEISFVLFVLAAVLFAVVPFSVSNIKQAKFISEWKNYMAQVSYSYETLAEYKKTNNLDDKASVKMLMNYLDATLVSDKNSLKNYKYKMMNGNIYQKIKIDRFDEIYKDVNHRLIGVQYMEKGCSLNLPCQTVWTDLNGTLKPNIVGKDIFVYEIYKDSVSPYGKGVSVKTMKEDCSKFGTGMLCSQYYILGGDLK